MMTECSFCGGDASAVEEREEFQVGQRSAVIDRVFMRCSDCGEEYVTEEQTDRNFDVATKKIRAEEGLLLPQEIRSIRERYDLTQEELEALIGAGPKTVTRWENGRVFQNSTANTLLRVLQHFPNVVAFLAREHGVEFKLSGSYEDLAQRRSWRGNSTMRVATAIVEGTQVIGTLTSMAVSKELLGGAMRSSSEHTVQITETLTGRYSRA